MKNLYFAFLLVLTSNLGFSQDTRLFENEWHLTDLILDNTSYPPIPNSEVPDISLRFYPQSPIFLETGVCNFGGGSIIFGSGGSDTFTFESGFAQSLMFCNLPDNNTYESYYFYFFSKDNATHIFSYSITVDGTVKTLIITRDDNDKAIYSSQQLSINRIIEDKKINIFPNPTTDYLNFQFKDGDLGNGAVEVYDGIGKLCLKEKFATNINPINVKNLTNGIYIVKIKNDNVTYAYKFIKI